MTLPTCWRVNITGCVIQSLERMAEWKFGFRRAQKKIKTKIKYILHTIKKKTSVTFSVYLCFNNV